MRLIIRDGRVLDSALKRVRLVNGVELVRAEMNEFVKEAVLIPRQGEYFPIDTIHSFPQSPAITTLSTTIYGFREMGISFIGEQYQLFHYLEYRDEDRRRIRRIRDLSCGFSWVLLRDSTTRFE